MTDPQQRVLIALTRDYPRTSQGIAVETNIPQASVRRIMGELRGRGIEIAARKVPVKYRFGGGSVEYTLGRFRDR